MPSTTFSFSLGPWSDHGNQRGLALIGREVGGDASIVSLHHDVESDIYLYGYRENDNFGKAFVQHTDSRHGDLPIWEVEVAALRYEGTRAGLELTRSQRLACVGKIIDALSQLPDSDVRRAVPGKILRQVIVRPPARAL
jgi:hypothetical protein